MAIDKSLYRSFSFHVIFRTDQPKLICHIIITSSHHHHITIGSQIIVTDWHAWTCKLAAVQYNGFSNRITGSRKHMEVGNGMKFVLPFWKKRANRGWGYRESCIVICRRECLSDKYAPPTTSYAPPTTPAVVVFWVVISKEWYTVRINSGIWEMSEVGELWSIWKE